jgi:ppGpp synthetase/RelA/SpoT-type nucleotidyltranferase
MLPGKQLQKLGKRLRLGSDPADVRLLNEYRRWFDPALLTAAFEINNGMGADAPPYLLSGRTKRTKSIVRKLVREPTMDLSRMTDIVGLRMIVDGAEEQRRVVARLPDVIRVERVADYTAGDHFYRAIHFQGSVDGRRIEIQVRTLAQQLWADESESFGEQAKEGQLTPEQHAYLSELRAAACAVEAGEAPIQLTHALATTRRPIEIGLQTLRRGFAEATEPAIDGEERTLLVVHDEVLNELTRQNVFGAAARADALAEYERLMTSLEQTRFSVLLLNARNLRALHVTHPRFFRGA